MNPSSSRKGPNNPWMAIGLATSIPTLLLSGPLVGFGLGWLLRRWLGWGPWIEWVFIVLGMIAGVRETIKIIRRLS